MRPSNGAIMQNLYGASSASIGNSTLGVEGIREYRVVTNSFSAEYGRTGTWFYSVTTKAGTNDVHGSVYDNFVNTALNARDFFQADAVTFEQTVFDRADVHGEAVVQRCARGQIHAYRCRELFGLDRLALVEQRPLGGHRQKSLRLAAAGDGGTNEVLGSHRRPVRDAGKVLARRTLPGTHVVCRYGSVGTGDSPGP